MAFRVNSFALLDGEESDDVSKIVTSAAAKHVASSQPFTAEKKLNNQSGQTQKTEKCSARLQFNSKPLSRSDQHARVERRPGREGRANDSGRYIEGEQSRNKHNHSWENSRRRINGHSNGYKQENGHADGVQQYNSQRANGYNPEDKRSNGNVPEKKKADDGNEQMDTDGFQVYHRKKPSGGSTINGSKKGKGWLWGGGGGRARARGYKGDNGFRNDNNGRVNKQVNGQGLNEISGGSEEKVNGGNHLGSKNQEARSSARQGGTSNGKSSEVKSSETKKQLGVEEDRKDNSSGDASGERNDRMATEASIDEDRRQGKHGNVATRDHSTNRIEEDTERKRMTLKQYEKQLLEKRKALEALKTEERKVALDKDFESMKLVDKKKEDSIFIKLNSGKDELRTDSSTKDKKVRKAMSIGKFLKPPKRGFYKKRGGRHQQGGGDTLPDGSPNFEDSRQFPALPAASGHHDCWAPNLKPPSLRFISCFNPEDKTD